MTWSIERLEKKWYGFRIPHYVYCRTRGVNHVKQKKFEVKSMTTSKLVAAVLAVCSSERHSSFLFVGVVSKWQGMM